MNRRATNGSGKRRAVPARVPVTVRLPAALINKIDQALDERDIPLSRNNWFLEAAIEKLRKNSSGERYGAK